jgi:negative regulator of flagellin synthesis FlgM
MPIEPSGLSSLDLNTGKGHAVSDLSRKEPTVAQGETGKPTSTETVSLTEAAEQLHRLETRITSLPVIDTQRVESVKQALEKGTYEFNLQRTAEKFLEFEVAINF